mmetsp:Transcript_14129/g.18515  ORF Transcript_14129/g.18515 Transcript_14129/m.18515 type:complete len:101 (-) Transcript_14129:61-363(-)
MCTSDATNRKCIFFVTAVLFWSKGIGKEWKRNILPSFRELISLDRDRSRYVPCGEWTPAKVPFFLRLKCVMCGKFCGGVLNLDSDFYIFAVLCSVTGTPD